MTILTRALSAIGLMRVSEHERIVADNDDIASERDRISANAIELMRAIEEMQAKFKKAVADLEKADREMRATDGLLTDAQMEAMELRNEIEGWKAAGQDLQADAQKWRGSLKRSPDRKEAKKNATPPARDKRAKNRGGERG